jgi:hypothetical protein
MDVSAEAWAQSELCAVFAQQASSTCTNHIRMVIPAKNATCRIYSKLREYFAGAPLRSTVHNEGGRSLLAQGGATERKEKISWSRQ